MNLEDSLAEPASRDPGTLRCRQPGVTRDRLDKEIASFETYFRDLPPYGPHLRWWIARYSRGDGLVSLREAFAEVVSQVDRDGHDAIDREGDGAPLFAYSDGFIGRYRDALVLLSIALCLHLPECTRTLLRWCERGDPLIETLAQANGAPRAEREAPPPFPEAFDGLYAALDAATPDAAADAVRAYLRVWLDERMDDMGFKISDQGLCYWCFEAAGVVAALNIGDGVFTDEPVYPADLVAFYREGE
jgi:hypothetical protein